MISYITYHLVSSCNVPRVRWKEDGENVHTCTHRIYRSLGLKETVHSRWTDGDICIPSYGAHDFMLLVSTQWGILINLGQLRNFDTLKREIPECLLCNLSLYLAENIT